MNKKHLAIAIAPLILALFIGLFSDYLPNGDVVQVQEQKVEERAETALTSERQVVLNQARIDHILYGDATGGGHKYGVGKPCKSEFPENWNDNKIIRVTKRIAANDNLRWRREDNGYYVTERMQDGVNVRVVLGSQKRRVITSYPINTPRNSCHNDARRYND